MGLPVLSARSCLADKEPSTMINVTLFSLKLALGVLVGALLFAGSVVTLPFAMLAAKAALLVQRTGGARAITAPSV